MRQRILRRELSALKIGNLYRIPVAVVEAYERGHEVRSRARYYTMNEAAKELRVSRRWLQDFLKDHPYYRMAGRRKIFSAANTDQLFEALPRPSDSRAGVTAPICTSAAQLLDSVCGEYANPHRARRRGRDICRALYRRAPPTSPRWWTSEINRTVCERRRRRASNKRDCRSGASLPQVRSC